MAVNVTENSYSETVENSDRPVLLDVWAPTCAPCRALEPVIAELAVAAGDKIVVAKLNADEYPALAAQIGVQGLPTVRIIRGGRTEYESVGMAVLATLAGAVGQVILEGA